jgi:hypothetical protein
MEAPGKPEPEAAAGNSVGEIEVQSEYNGSPAADAKGQVAGQQITAYQGIPARVQIPNNGVFREFQTSLIEAKAPLALRTILYRTYLRTLFVLVLIGLLMKAIYRNRIQFCEALRVRSRETR